MGWVLRSVFDVRRLGALRRPFDLSVLFELCRRSATALLLWLLAQASGEAAAASIKCGNRGNRAKNEI
jgi:hypothetical protein